MGIDGVHVHRCLDGAVGYDGTLGSIGGHTCSFLAREGDDAAGDGTGA